ncbi:type II toxin-antitoxin system Phd/YefM family antitoxin [Sphaerotilus microaerophilus]|jgi:prevent-host-death family protein|uniref:Antitoxin n=1 Tax=Sphaerotilus microaerophilus TaxID=2914710 RepID=A0ABN6PQX3_9BURK|nr:type II toxin-antitoxin system prevent-host-death family antitoxin [Sphaerotilus sp. FB-5]BDI07576.1 hypothetical protein CATMQ487_45460 [Sphaerotilus sp. FB-5]
MLTVNVHDAKTRLSRLLAEVEKGESVVIARAGRPIATLTAYQPPARRVASPGSMAGKIAMSDDFDEPLDDLFDALKPGDAPAA